jgi:hypothetical protein
VESQIERAILALEPGRFQRLVEAWAELKWPARYEALVPLGRTAVDATRKGWPDAFAQAGASRHVVEATAAQAWHPHLLRDVKRVLAMPSGSVLSFLFVCRAPQPSTDEVLEGVRADLCAHGVPADDIGFVFLPLLRRDLARPRFAKIRAELLDLPSGTAPFVPFEHASALYGGTELSTFVPTLEEFLAGLPGQNRLRVIVESRLEARGWSLIRGQGAAGKTVLATEIALRWEARLHPALYLDAARHSLDAERSQIEHVLATAGDQAVLFVIDNVHLAEDAARELFDYWQALESGSRLLLSGRTGSASAPGSRRGLANLDGAGLVLRPGPSELLGIYERLSQRIGALRPAPPRDVLERWASVFAGDLVAFSAALAERLGRPWSDWTLTDLGARQYVRDRYLYVLPPSDREHLVRLAACTWLEVAAPPSVADPHALAPLLRSGAVIQSGEETLLVHPGVGQLVLQASGYDLPASEVLIDIAERFPVSGWRLAGALASRDRGAAASIARISFLHGGGSILLTQPLGHLRLFVVLLVQTGIPFERIDDALAADPGSLRSALEHTVSRDLETFLIFGQGRLPQTFAAAAELFGGPNGPPRWIAGTASDLKGLVRLAAVYRSCWPGHLSSLDALIAETSTPVAVAASMPSTVINETVLAELRELDSTLPITADVIDQELDKNNEVWIACVRFGEPSALARLAHTPPQAFRRLAQLISNSIQDPTFAGMWLDGRVWASNSHAGFLVAEFFRALPHARDALIEALADPRRVESWARRVISRGPVALVRLLGGSYSDAEVLVTAVIVELEQDEHRDRLRAMVRRSALPEVMAACRALSSHPQLQERLTTALFEPEAEAAAVTQILAMTPREFARFTFGGEIARRLLRIVDDDNWRDSRVMREPAATVRRLRTLVRQLGGGDAERLLRPVGRSLLQALMSGELDGQPFSIAHLSHALRLTSDPALTARVGRHLVQDSELIETLIGSASPEDTSHALYSMWSHASDVAGLFARSSLAQRVEMDWQWAIGENELRYGLPQLDRGLLGLAGTATLIGTKVSNETFSGYTQELFAKSLDAEWSWLSDEGPSYLPPGLVILWLGVRAVHTRAPRLKPPIGHLEVAYAALGNTKPSTEHQRCLFEQLGNWMRQQIAGNGLDMSDAGRPQSSPEIAPGTTA